MIEAFGLTKRHGSLLAVDNVTFKVQPGRVTGFLGPNGAGKSTTMRMLLGLETPTAGSALVGGRRYRQLERPLHSVGSMLDTAGFHGGRDAWNHLAYLAVSNDLPRSRVRVVLDLVGLGDAAHRRVRGFSLGMRQRLGIAAALLGDPEILVLDEPSNGLDPQGIVWIRNMLKEQAAKGRTVFISSHLISEMAVMADHLIVIDRGRIVADASLPDFLAVAQQQENQADALEQAARRSLLEDAYLRVTSAPTDVASGADEEAAP